MAIWSRFVAYSQIYSASREGAWRWSFVLKPAFNSSLVDSTYDCKTYKNATLTGQEEEGDVQLKVSNSFVLLQFDFWTILVHGSLDGSSHFVHVNINILTHTMSGPPVIWLNFVTHFTVH